MSARATTAPRAPLLDVQERDARPVRLDPTLARSLLPRATSTTQEIVDGIPDAAVIGGIINAVGIASAAIVLHIPPSAPLLGMYLLIGTAVGASYFPVKNALGARCTSREQRAPTGGLRAGAPDELASKGLIATLAVTIPEAHAAARALPNSSRSRGFGRIAERAVRADEVAALIRRDRATVRSTCEGVGALDLGPTLQAMSAVASPSEQAALLGSYVREAGLAGVAALVELLDT